MRKASEPTDGQLVELFAHAERVAARIVGRSRAEDIASEAMIRLVAAWPRVADFSHRWVARVVANLAVDDLRRQAVGQRSQPGTPPVGGFEDTVGDRLDLVLLLGGLSHRQRQSVVLHHMVGLEVEEIALTPGVSVHTIRTHLDRGMRALRDPSARPRKDGVDDVPD